MNIIVIAITALALTFGAGHVQEHPALTSATVHSVSIVTVHGGIGALSGL